MNRVLGGPGGRGAFAGTAVRESQRAGDRRLLGGSHCCPGPGLSRPEHGDGVIRVAIPCSLLSHATQDVGTERGLAGLAGGP